MNASPKILIIRLSSLGDILHTLPAFAGLRAAFPDAGIDWLVSDRCKFLLAAVSGIRALHVLDTTALLHWPPQPSAWRRLWNLIRSLRAQHYDISIDFQGLLKTALLGCLSGSGTRLGFSGDLVREPPAHWFYHRTLEKPERQVHIVAQNQMLAALAGVSPVPMVFDFQVSEEDQRHVDSLRMQKQLADYIVLNPGGGWPTKRWSPEKYGSLAKRIQAELGLPVVVTTGPGEENMYQTIAEQCGDTAPHHFPIFFLQLIPLLKKAHLFVGGDTGPFHLACAMGIPVVGIFGPTSPIRNGAWRDGEEMVTRMLPCSPCHARACPTNSECMDITVDEVFAAVIRRLGRLEGFVACAPEGR